MGDTEEDSAQLKQMLADGETMATADPVRVAMTRMFERDETQMPPVNPDGSILYQ